jgi:hypothetical protein
VTGPRAGVRPFRHYQRLIDPETAEPCTVLHYSYSDLRQSEIDARMEAIRIEVEEKWRTKLRLNSDDVRKLAWAMSVMQATDPKEESSHPVVVEHEKLKRAHQRVDEAVRELSKLKQELSLLTEFHRKHRSSSAEVFEQLRSATTAYFEARRPAWGPWLRLSVAWHRDALYLMDILEKAAKQARRPLSFTNETAPAVKFISWALEMVGTERSTEAIVQVHRRHVRSPAQRKPRGKARAGRRIRRSAFSISVARP